MTINEKGAGRKKLPDSLKRVGFSCRVLPETKDKIGELRASGVRFGEEIDRLVGRLYKEIEK